MAEAVKLETARQKLAAFDRKVAEVRRARSGRVYLAQWAFVVLATIGLAEHFYPQVRASRDPFQWDLMLLTGALTMLVGLMAAGRFERRVRAMLGRLVDSDVVKLDGLDCDLPALQQAVEDRAETTGRWVGAVFGVLVLLAFVFTPGQHGPLLYALGLVGGFFVFYHLGRFFSYGRIGHYLLEERKLAIEADPQHPDGVAGLRPVGKLFFRQAMLVAVPAVFIAVWSLVLPVWPDTAEDDYSEWRLPFLGFFLLALGSMVLAFLGPMWSFHRIMRERKEAAVKMADESSRRMVQIKAMLAETKDEQARKLLLEELQRRQEHYTAVEDMPTWPVDTGTRRRFINRNLVLAVLPLVGNAGPWKDVIKALFGA